MAQHAMDAAENAVPQTGFVSPAEAVEAADGGFHVPLDLAPHLKAYRARTRIVIRIERLPTHARLSRGRNNGDGSWSLGLDELEGLMCLLPAEASGPRTLALRIIDVETGATLDVVDLPIVAAPKGEVGHENTDDGDALASRKGDVDESKFSSLTASLLVRKRSTPASASSAAGGARKSKTKAAGAAPDFLVGKGDAGPSNPLPPSSAPSTGDQGDGNLDQLRAQCAALEAHLAARETELAGAQAAAARQVAAVEARWQEEYRKGLADTRSEATRQLAASEAQWEEQFKRNLTELRANSQATREQTDQSVSALRNDCAVLRATIGSRELELQELRAASEQERTQSQHALRDALAKAETAWKADTARRFAEAEAQWRSAIARHDLETQKLREESKQARERARVEMQEVRAEAEAAWRADTVRQLAQADAKWQEQLQRSLADAKAQSKGAASQADELHRVRHEYAALKDAFANSETALAKMQTAAQEERQRWRHELEKALSQAQSAWKAHSDRELAAAEARWQEQSKAAVTAARTAAAATHGQGDAELIRVQEECARLRAALAKAEAALVQAHADSEQTVTRSKRDLERKAASATNTERQLAAVEARCKTLIEERGQATAARESIERECGALREALAKSESTLEAARREAKEAQERSRQEVKDALLKADAGADEHVARQLAAAEARWKEETKQTIARVQAEAASLRTEAAGEVVRSRHELETAQQLLAERDAELERLRAEAEGLRNKTDRLSKDAVLQAEKSWKANEASRLAAAEARWKEETRQAIARIEAQANAPQSEASAEDPHSRQELEMAQQLLAEKEAELERLRAEAEGLRNETERRSKEAVILAERSWKANEASKLAAAEAQWKQRTSRELADATTRFETAERALAQLRIRNSARDATDNEEIARLRDELAALQANLAARSNDGWQGDAASTQETRIVLRTNKDWDNLDQARNNTQRKNAAAGMLVAAALAIAAVALFVGLGASGLRLSIPELSHLSSASQPQRSTTIAAPIEDKTVRAVLSHGGNLRDGPNTTSAVMSSLAKGAEVTVMEQRGKWTQVRVSDGRQGWIYSEFLQVQAKDGTGEASAAKPK